MLRQKHIDDGACKAAGASMELATFPALLGIAGALFADVRHFPAAAPQDLAQHQAVGSGLRYMICITLFCTLHESKNTRQCENSTRLKNTRPCEKQPCFFYSHNVRQNMISRATAY